jgi:hypothetical protein
LGSTAARAAFQSSTKTLRERLATNPILLGVAYIIRTRAVSPPIAESEEIMKKLVVSAMALAVVVGLASLAFAVPSHMETGAWSGWVTDTACAEKGASASHADCAVKCVKEKGAKWALYDPATKSVVVLEGDAAKDAEKFAGKEVTVKGTLNKQTKTVAVTSIAAKG